MDRTLSISDQNLDLSDLTKFTFARSKFARVSVSESAQTRVAKSHALLQGLIERGGAIYGVTTGFGDSAFRLIPSRQSETLQSNLVSYLLCGTGPILSREASRATLAIRLKSLCRGHSGVSPELIERMRLYVEKDWVSVIPREGSLGASGDLIPLAYIAQALQGAGEIHTDDGIRKMADVLRENGIENYVLKPKEGLALVNGTSAMAGLALTNLAKARNLSHLATMATAWLTIAIKGRTDSFGSLVNSQANRHDGQSRAAASVTELLHAEGYASETAPQVGDRQAQLTNHVQDRYSLRCMPQIMGPILETLDLVERWVETEVNGISDNPLISDDGVLASGGNFYGGYLSLGTDYLKISLANLADMIDRQLMLVVDEKTNRGLPANLAAWNVIPEEDRFLFHGLKGLHQATSAITSEIMAQANPNSTHSRSSESHNQDKVSLGMSAAVRCSEMIEQVTTIVTMHLTCLAQALDLRGVKLKGEQSRALYGAIRDQIPFVARDMALDQPIANLRTQLAEIRMESL